MASCAVLPSSSKPTAMVRPHRVHGHQIANDDLDPVQQLQQSMEGHGSRIWTDVEAATSRSPAVVARFNSRVPNFSGEPTVRPVQPLAGTKRNSSGDGSCSTYDGRLAAVYYSLTKCSFYFEKMSHLQAKARLEPTSPGTFLLRDSSDPQHCFALSVRTIRGTMSIRIARTAAGQFQLDCEEVDSQAMPAFDCILQLCEHYLVGRQLNNSGGSSCVFLEKSGRMDTPVLLTQPLDIASYRNTL